MNESRLVKVSRNILYSLFFKGSTLIVNFISRIIFVRILDARYLGISGLFTNIISVLSLADLGVGTAMMYCLYKPLAQNDENKIIALVQYFKKVYLIIAGSVLMLGLGVLPFLEFFVNLEAHIKYLEIYYFLFLLNTVCSYLFIYRTILLTADQKDYLISKYNIIFQNITFFCKTVVLVITKSFVVYLLTENVCILLNNILLNKVAIKNYAYLKKKQNYKLDRKEKTEIFYNVKALFLYRFSGVIQGNTDSILLSVFVGTETVGFYSNYMIIVNGIVGVITMLFASIKASVGNLVSESNGIQKSYKIFKIMELINFWLIGFITVCFIVLLQDVIRLFFGESYLINNAAVIAIALNFYTNHIRQSIWTYRETTGLFQQTKYITLVTAILNMLLSIVGGYYLGMFGILIATVIARLVYAWWKEPIILYREYFHRNAEEYFEKYIFRILFCVGVSVGAGIIVMILPVWNLWIQILVKFLVCFVIFHVAFLIFYSNTEEFKALKMKIVQMKKGCKEKKLL